MESVIDKPTVSFDPEVSHLIGYASDWDRFLFAATALGAVVEADENGFAHSVRHDDRAVMRDRMPPYDPRPYYVPFDEDGNQMLGMWTPAQYGPRDWIAWLFRMQTVD